MRCKRTYKGSKVQAGSSWLSVDWTSTASIWEEAATTPLSTQPRSLKQTQIKRATFSKSSTEESSNGSNNKQATHMMGGINKKWNNWASSYQHLQVPRAQFRQTFSSCWIAASSEASVISSLDI